MMKNKTFRDAYFKAKNELKQRPCLDTINNYIELVALRFGHVPVGAIDFVRMQIKRGAQ